MERLQKFMSNAGVASRRKCEEIILEKRVRVNDTVICELGIKVDPSIDKIYVDDKLISTIEEKIYIMLNKPEGVVSTVSDEKGRETIIDVVNITDRIYPIGRLDYDTSGLILLTNDGEVYNKIIHPRVQINKVYIAELEGIPSEKELNIFKTGVDIGDYVTAEANIELLQIREKSCQAKITIHEGKNRQIRRMCTAIGHEVKKLKRVSVGELQLDNLPIGKWRNLTKSEILYLNNL